MGAGQGTGVGLREDALRDLRATRRRRFVGQLDVMEVVYRVYITAIFGGIALAVIAGAVHDADLSARVAEKIADQGPALLGLALAAAALAGLRSGSRGGPLAIEGAELQYVLLAPIDRGLALRGSAMRQVRVGVIGGAVLGLIAANFVFRRLPGSPLEWFGCLALFGALLPLCLLGPALLASGRRVGPRAATAIGVGLVTWSAADVLLGVRTSPATMLGALATLPLRGGSEVILAAVGALAVVLVAAVGLRSLGGLSLEAARRRASLTAELRFSASVQDLRAVILLRRQLASEGPRRSPWLRLRGASPARFPVWRRGWQSLLRWPAARIARACAVGVLAGALAAAAWSGTTPLVALAGVVLLLAALDLVEPLAQEIDHPLRCRSLPISPQTLAGRHLVAPIVAMCAVTAIAALAANLLGPSATAIEVGAVTVAPTAAVVLACAAFSASTDPYDYLLSPQLGYAMTALPILISSAAVAGPVLVARESVRREAPAVGGVLTIELLMLIVGAALIAAVGSRLAKRAAATA